jgi:hypothetical protein
MNPSGRSGSTDGVDLDGVGGTFSLMATTAQGHQKALLSCQNPQRSCLLLDLVVRLGERDPQRDQPRRN